MLAAVSTGFLVSFSLILAIGAQNALVLRQGLTKTHVFWVCLFCAVSDAILIGLGVLGFGAITTIYPNLPMIMALAGAAFLICYGALRFWAAYKGDYHAEISGEALPLSAAIARIAAVTWLNPHVYLDTLALIGAVSTPFSGGQTKTAFAFGAMLASFVFFFSLGYGARQLAPLMQSAKAWRVLDVLIGIVMFMIAAALIATAFHK